MFVSHPSVRDPLQSPRPASQTYPQRPAAHAASAPATEAHTLPHAPQFAGLLLVSTHAPEHIVVPAPHETAHIPAEHTCPAAHAFPHAPQFARSVARSRHAPAQFVVPVAQLSAQLPPAQT